MLSMYPAYFIKEENNYSVIFPDLNWLSTCGSTLSDAMTAAVDCLAGHLYFCKQCNQVIEPPSSIEKIDIKKIAYELEITTDKGSFVNIVTVDVDLYAKEHFEKTVKKTLTIPHWINKAAVAQNINFSLALQEALLEKLKATDK